LVRSRFLNSVAEAEVFLQRARAARRPGSKQSALSAAEVRWAYEIAFLKVAIAWEVYLEYALGCYAVGERSPSGYRARRKTKLKASVLGALRIFRGDREFVGWLSPSAVIERATRWLDAGGPFEAPMTAASAALGYLRLLRNAIAHESEAAQEKFLER